MLNFEWKDQNWPIFTTAVFLLGREDFGRERSGVLICFVRARSITADDILTPSTGLEFCHWLPKSPDFTHTG